MPRGPADRPVRKSDEDLALQAAMGRALEQGAAAVAAGRTPDPDPAKFGTRVAEPAPSRGIGGVTRARGARSIVLSKPKRKEKKESPSGPAVPDPRGRGRRIDVRL